MSIWPWCTRSAISSDLASWASRYKPRGEVDHSPADAVPQWPSPRPESGSRWARRLPRPRRRRAHQLALPHLRRRGVRATDGYTLLGARRACDGADLDYPRLDPERGTGAESRFGAGRTYFTRTVLAAYISPASTPGVKDEESSTQIQKVARQTASQSPQRLPEQSRRHRVGGFALRPLRRRISGEGNKRALIAAADEVDAHT